MPLTIFGFILYIKLLLWRYAFYAQNLSCMFNFLSLINKNKKKKNIQKSYSNLFETTLVKSENCTVKITFEPLKIISTNVYLISASFIRYPTPLIISAYILPWYIRFLVISYITNNNNNNHHMNCLP